MDTNVIQTSLTDIARERKARQRATAAFEAWLGEPSRENWQELKSRANSYRVAVESVRVSDLTITGADFTWRRTR